MRALFKSLCAAGMVAAAVVAAASAQELRSNGTTAGTGSTTPDGGITYDAGGAPYSPRQQNYDSSNDFQLQGQGLNDPENARKPNEEKNTGDKK